jgi:hypothetical protein
MAYDEESKIRRIVIDPNYLITFVDLSSQVIANSAYFNPEYRLKLAVQLFAGSMNDESFITAFMGLQQAAKGEIPGVIDIALAQDVSKAWMELAILRELIPGPTENTE